MIRQVLKDFVVMNLLPLILGFAVLGVRIAREDISYDQAMDSFRGIPRFTVSGGESPPAAEEEAASIERKPLPDPFYLTGIKMIVLAIGGLLLAVFSFFAALAGLVLSFFGVPVFPWLGDLWIQYWQDLVVSRYYGMSDTWPFILTGVIYAWWMMMWYTYSIKIPLWAGRN